MPSDRKKLQGVWVYGENGQNEYRVEVYHHESRGNYSMGIFNLEQGLYRFKSGADSFGTVERALSSAEETIESFHRIGT